MLLTASPYRHLVYYTTGMANLKKKLVENVYKQNAFIRKQITRLVISIETQICKELASLFELMSEIVCGCLYH